MASTGCVKGNSIAKTTAEAQGPSDAPLTSTSDLPAPAPKDSFQATKTSPPPKTLPTSIVARPDPISTTPPLEEVDPYLWLEETTGDRAMEWVQEQNTRSLGVLESDPRFASFQETAQDLLEDKNRIPASTIRGNFVYDFVQNAKHVRGIWRRTTTQDYRSKHPHWKTVLNLDSLAASEGENWVWNRPTCLPNSARCLLNLSRGGQDAVVIREFDTRSKQFVRNGFHLEEARQSAEWLDLDHIMVMSDFGIGSMTTSGYPRIVKEWERSTPLAGARILFEGLEGDLLVGGSRLFRPEGSLDLFGETVAMFDTRLFLRRPDDSFVPVPVPAGTSPVGAFDGMLLFVLRSAWRPDGSETEIPANSLIALDARHLIAGENGPPPVSIVYTPGKRTAITDIATTSDAVYISILDNLNGRIARITPTDQNGKTAWTLHYLPIPAGGQVNISTADPFSQEIYINYEGFLTPKSQLRYNPKSDTMSVTQSMKDAFDTTGLVIEQREAISRDGTSVPYFIVRSRDLPFDGSTPTLLHGYGGFEITQLPSYSKTIGKLWLEQGGAYVMANIRGGGEFGAEWHTAAIKENRQRAFDDFIAVAEDLIRRSITSPRRLGIWGGSNGGLLVSAVATQRPDLFNAVICENPVIDMLRYTELPVGKTWIGEYGDPNDPAMRASLLRYSPYHNLKQDVHYPEILFLTSTNDDRVHPGHARKMAARMLQQGHPFLYYENTEGGHSSTTNKHQEARKTALTFTYLFRKLID